MISLYGVSYSIGLIAGPFFNKLFVDRVSLGGNFSYLIAPIFLLLGLQFIETLLSRVTQYLSIGFFSETQANIRIYLLRNLHNHSYSYFAKQTSGNLGHRIAAIEDGFESIMVYLIYEVLPAILSMVLTLVLTAHVNYLIALIFIVWFFSEIIVSYFLGDKALLASENFSNKRSQLIGSIIDSIINVVSVKMFSSGDREIRYIKKISNDEVVAKVSYEKKSLLVTIIVNIIDFGFFLVFLPILIYLYGQNRVTVGDFILIYGLFDNFGRALAEVSASISSTIETIGIMTSNLSLIFAKKDIEDKTDKVLNLKSGEIEFKDVTLRYGEVAAIKNLNLKIRSKEKIGIVGSSGAGKSSILNVLMRFYECEGRILIDGQDIKGVTQESLRNCISYISQEPILFNRTVLENIIYGRENYKEEELHYAIESANAEFVYALPQGLDTPVGERGMQLSGGQRQRVVIARAILKDSPILLMDEATSALDSETELELRAGMDQLMKNKTVLIVAHQLNTVRKLDRLIVMDCGKIVEDGTHETLLSKNGYYAKLWQCNILGF